MDPDPGIIPELGLELVHRDQQKVADGLSVESLCNLISQLSSQIPNLGKLKAGQEVPDSSMPYDGLPIRLLVTGAQLAEHLVACHALFHVS